MSKESKKIVFTVINDLIYDRRMDRICSSLAKNGYSVTLVGRVLPDSKELERKIYFQKRLKCWFNKGGIFYAEYNIRLFMILLFYKFDIYGAIDLDTILANKLVSKIKNKPMVYDAHEYFTEVIEIQSKPRIKRFWQWVESVCLDRNTYAYTVSASYAKLFKEKYGTNFEVIRNCPSLKELLPVEKYSKFTFIYVGAVNAGRGIEECIEAIKDLPANLKICGDGDILDDLKNNLAPSQRNQVSFTGYLHPLELEKEIEKSHVGLLLLKAESLSYVYSLANKFFDYVHAEVPQIVIDFPEYLQMNRQIEVAKICSIQTEDIKKAMSFFIEDKEEYNRLKINTIFAKKQWNWDVEEAKLLNFYKQIS